MKIEHDEPRLIQKMLVSYPTGDEQRLQFAYDTIGAETAHAGGGRSCAHWNGLELVIESVMKINDRELHFKDHWALSPDGETITMAHRDDDLDGLISVLERVSCESPKFDVSQ